jgi:hypothetical protein
MKRYIDNFIQTIYSIKNTLINSLHNLYFNLKSPSKYDYDEFSVSIGEICESCRDEMELYNGGFRGVPSKCKSCKRQEKIEKLGI